MHAYYIYKFMNDINDDILVISFIKRPFNQENIYFDGFNG